MENGNKTRLPLWITIWLVASGVICTWDASFILMRPESFPGGKYATFWKPYELYIEVDTRYKDMDDTFVYVVSIMNCAEVGLNFFAVYLSSTGSIHTAALAFTTSVMVFWKTVLYLLQYIESFGGGRYSAHNDLFRTAIVLWLPNIIWILAPLLVIVRLWSSLLPGQNSTGGGKTKHDTAKSTPATPTERKQLQKKRK